MFNMKSVYARVIFMFAFINIMLILLTASKLNKYNTKMYLISKFTETQCKVIDIKPGITQIDCELRICYDTNITVEFTDNNSQNRTFNFNLAHEVNYEKAIIALNKFPLDSHFKCYYHIDNSNFYRLYKDNADEELSDYKFYEIFDYIFHSYNISDIFSRLSSIKLIFFFQKS